MTCRQMDPIGQMVAVARCYGLACDDIRKIVQYVQVISQSGSRSTADAADMAIDMLNVSAVTRHPQEPATDAR